MTQREDCRAPRIVGTSRPMRDVLEMVARVAGTRSTVLDPGRDRDRQGAHRARHPRREPAAARPFVPVNCGALAEGVLESELFGHVKGAFTGAVIDRRAACSRRRTTGRASSTRSARCRCVQAKLLRVLQEHEIKRVGGTDRVGVDVRVIAATNRDLAALIDGGRFREDLFYRLSVVTLQVPPLRDGARTFRSSPTTFCACTPPRAPAPSPGIAPEALALLVAYDWPGNVRELEHAVERAVALTTSSSSGPRICRRSARQARPPPRPPGRRSASGGS